MLDVDADEEDDEAALRKSGGADEARVGMVDVKVRPRLDSEGLESDGAVEEEAVMDCMNCELMDCP